MHPPASECAMCFMRPIMALVLYFACGKPASPQSCNGLFLFKQTILQIDLISSTIYTNKTNGEAALMKTALNARANTWETTVNTSSNFITCMASSEK